MPKKILLADDSITIQKVVELTFSDGDYEVTAVNNGAKAVQKLSEMRPDIILSDIIMPEKNGYEVCEYVKSHPDFRNIPVVLLTGTFEPFDPDRAEKAGCDAVVTKPFESQSLIQRVEELIAQSATAAPVAAAAPEPEPEAASPWMDEPAPAAPASPLATGVFAPPAETFTHDQDIFSAPPAAEAPMAMPFDTPPEAPLGVEPPAEAFSSETRAFPRMSFDEFQQPPATEPPPPPPVETPTWSLDAPAAEESAWGSEPPPPPPAFDAFGAQPSAPSPFDQAPVEDDGSTRAFPKMSFEELPPAVPAETGVPDWNAPEAPAFSEEAPAFQETPAFGGETRAFPKMSFDDFQQPQPVAGFDMPATEPEAPAFDAPSFEPESQPAAFGAEASTPLDTESPAFGAETSAFPKMSFDDLQQPAPSSADQAGDEFEEEPSAPQAFVSEPEAPAAEPLPWEEEPAQPAEFWSPASDRPDYDAPGRSAPDSFDENEPDAVAFERTTADEAAPAFEAAPEQEAEAQSEAEMQPEIAAQPEWASEDVPAETAAEPSFETEPEWARPEGAATEAEAFAEPDEPVIPPAVLAPAIAAATDGADLTDEQIDRIARRVVELMSEKVVRNIAWEVIPDMAEMVVKERIRQLEAEA